MKQPKLKCTMCKEMFFSLLMVGNDNNLCEDCFKNYLNIIELQEQERQSKLHLQERERKADTRLKATKKLFADRKPKQETQLTLY